MSQIFKKYRFLLPTFLVIFLIVLSPWITDGVGNWYPGRKCDIRLRTKIFPSEYFNLETYFNNERGDSKALFLPMGGVVDYNDDYKYHGLCNESWDLFGGFSPIPGSVAISDRQNVYINDFVEAINVKTHKDILGFLSLTNIKYIVVRKNAITSNDSAFYQDLKILATEHKITIEQENDKLAVFLVDRWYPHIFFKSAKPVTMTYKKINITKYEVSISHVISPFSLIFLESFDPLWRAYFIPQGKNSGPQLSDSTHKIVNGYANSWMLDPQELCGVKGRCLKNQDGSYNLKIALDFLPQRFLIVEMIISFTTFLIILIYFCVRFLLWQFRK